MSIEPDRKIYLQVDRECVRLGLRAGAMLLKGVSVSASNQELKHTIQESVSQARTTYGNVADIRNAIEITKFREIIKAVGADTKKSRPSVESLMRYAVQKENLPAINNLVDIYNSISIRTLCSMGAHDLDHIALPVELRFLHGNESFVPLGKTTKVALPAREFAYVDATNRVLCRLDILQADFCKITENTTNVLLIIEATAAHTKERIAEAFQLCAKMIPKYCGGKATIVAAPQPGNPRAD